MNYPKKLMSKVINFDNQLVKISLCKATYLYDILGECLNTDCLEKIRKTYNSESKVFKKGRFGKPLVVIDTFFELENAKEVYLQLEDILKEVKE